MHAIAIAVALLNPINAALVEDLGAEDFRQREAASRSLNALGPLAYPHLETALESDDPEIAARASALLRPCWMARADPLVLPTSGKQLPWIDALPINHPDRTWIWECRRQHAFDGLQQVGGNGIPVPSGDFPSYREATRLWVRDQLLSRERPSRIRAALDVMESVEAEWHRQGKVTGQ